MSLSKQEVVDRLNHLVEVMPDTVSEVFTSILNVTDESNLTDVPEDIFLVTREKDNDKTSVLAIINYLLGDDDQEIAARCTVNWDVGYSMLDVKEFYLKNKEDQLVITK